MNRKIKYLKKLFDIMGLRQDKILSKKEITGYKALANFLNKKLVSIKSDSFERIIIRS